MATESDALGPGWALRGVVRGPREVDPPLRSAGWAAFARPDSERHNQLPLLVGSGADPVEALLDLAVRLRQME